MASRTHVFLFAGAMLLAPISTLSASDDTRQLDSHEHGHASLNVAIDGKSLVIEFESPAVNIVGFEHEPENDAQKHQIEEAEETLSMAEKVFAIPAGAGCKLVEADVEAPHDEHHDDHKDEKHDDHKDEKHDDHKDEKHEGEVHSEFHAKWLFECQDVAKLDSVDVNLFKLFPGTEEIDASVIGRSGQSAVELTASNTRIGL